tara:strand:+ start:137 stop:247 length:111 start_codon:yes stop_codon:yes gene_type:complete
MGLGFEKNFLKNFLDLISASLTELTIDLHETIWNPK